MKPEAFIALEASTASTLQFELDAAAKRLLRGVQPLISAKDFIGAHEAADKFVLTGVVEEQRNRIVELATSSVLFGAANAAGSLKNSGFVQGRDPIPPELQQAINQLVIMIEVNGADYIRDELHDLIAFEEKVYKDKLYEVVKADVSLADRLNAAVLGTGKAVVDIGANLTTSRLVNLGFLAEAVNQGITTYQVNEVLDDRTCPVCRYMHGKTFRVAEEYQRTVQVLGTFDPQELKGLAPWPKQNKASLEALYSMSVKDMQAAGYGSPPYHPGCRGMLTLEGTVEEEIPTGLAQAAIQLLIGTKSKAPDPVDVGPVSVGVLDDLFDLALVTDTVLRAHIASLSDAALRQRAIEAFVNGDLKRVRAILAKEGISI